MTTPPIPSVPSTPSTPYRQRAEGAPADGYTSPIPVRRAHFGDALLAEWTKIRSIRSTLWTLGVMVALMLGLGLFIALSLAWTDSGYPEQTVLPLGFFGVMLSSICVITLGVITMTSEFGTGLVRTTLTACPSRTRVLGAKSVVYFALVFVISLMTTTLVGALQTSILNGPPPTGNEWLQATVGVSLFLATLGLFALAIGTLIRHSAGAVTIMIGLVLLPPVLGLFMAGSPWLGAVRDFLYQYSIPMLLVSLYENPTGLPSPSGWWSLWLMIAATAAAMAGALWSLHRRDA
ncbi:ABC transporter permease subunit [Streptomyces hebeiensis]|uniref:ABC transporter permease subunit n=1 Tax=Streptomyces hebeiensis TaxID=229486 RepID=A0ABN1UG37_9ACTN